MRIKTACLALVLLSAAAGWLFGQGAAIPPPDAESAARLAASPRHAEWVSFDAGGVDPVRAFVVYPERADKAPVVVVIHEIFGLTDWARSVADQLAAEGFLAIAPDFLSGKDSAGKGTAGFTPEEARRAMGTLTPDEVSRRTAAAASYALALPAARQVYGVVGYCWGGAACFTYATRQPNLGAAVVYYGTSPATETLAAIRAPILGLYGGEDNRVNSTIPAAEAELARLGKSFQYEIYPGAGHAFLKQQDQRNGANLAAALKAWPKTLEFLRKHLGK